VTAYEILRAAVLARPPVIVAGLGAVLRGGVRAWMDVVPTRPLDQGAAPHGDRAATTDVAARHRELVAIWAQMAARVSAEVVHG
jgi:hypothetical protein